jgi:hypothetical protein
MIATRSAGRKEEDMSISPLGTTGAGALDGGTGDAVAEAGFSNALSSAASGGGAIAGAMGQMLMGMMMPMMEQMISNEPRVMNGDSSGL